MNRNLALLGVGVIATSCAGASSGLLSHRAILSAEFAKSDNAAEPPPPDQLPEVVPPPSPASPDKQEDGIEVTTEIGVQALRTVTQDFSMSGYHGSENCTINENRTQWFSPPQEWTPTRIVEVHPTTGNCGSNVAGTSISGRQVAVTVHLQGCGEDCFLGCWCKGRGWIGFSGTYSASKEVPLPVAPFRQTQFDSSKTAFKFTHPGVADARIVGWNYKTSVRVFRSSKVIQSVDVLSDVTPSVSWVQTSLDKALRTVLVDVRVDLVRPAGEGAPVPP